MSQWDLNLACVGPLHDIGTWTQKRWPNSILQIRIHFRLEAPLGKINSVGFGGKMGEGANGGEEGDSEQSEV